MRLKPLIALSAIAALSLSAAMPASAQDDDPRAQLVATGKAMYEQRCGLCHAAEAGKESMAPPLYNVLGRKPGSVAGYQYTPRITLLDLTWTEQTLWSWIQTTTFDTPLIAMRHVGVKDPSSADAIVAYLASINKPNAPKP